MLKSIVLAFLLILPAALQAEPLQVLASTTIIADVARNIGGDLVEVSALIPPESDAHAFQPDPQDLVRVAEADVLLVNGAGLEEGLLDLMRSAASVEFTVVSYGVDMLAVEDDAHLGAYGVDVDCDAEAHDEEEEHEGEEDHEHGLCDPHVWWNPQNVKVWADNIAAAFAAADPAAAELYFANAEAYKTQLDELDLMIEESLDWLPAEQRVLVTNHDFLSYFADRYQFEIIATVLPGASSLAEPAPSDLAALMTLLRERAVRVIISEGTDTERLVDIIAADLGDVEVLRLYAESLSLPEGPASSYIDYLRANVEALVLAYDPVEFDGSSDNYSETGD